MAVDTRRRLEDQPRSRLWTAPGLLGRPGVHPESSVIGLVSPRAGWRSSALSSVAWAFPAEVVETRRLELLTLSLQRRRSAN